jgi:hypothetical protein
MRARALAFLVLTGAGLVPGMGAGASAASPASDGESFMHLFTTACAERSDYDAAKAAALADGWVSVGKDPDPDLQNMLKQTRVIGKRLAAVGSKMTFEAYVKQDGGHRYALVLASTRGRPGQPGFLDCNLYDFTGAAPVDPALVEAALAVTNRQHQADRGGSFDTWTLDGAPESVTLSFIPPASEVAGVVGYSGVSLTLATYAVML